jgi:hypothetical protein
LCPQEPPQKHPPIILLQHDWRQPFEAPQLAAGTSGDEPHHPRLCVMVASVLPLSECSMGFEQIPGFGEFWLLGVDIV